MLDKSNACTTRLRIGSDVEVAQRTLELLRDGGEPLIFDRGSFHIYAADTGLWTPLARAAVERAVHRFDGLRCATKTPFRANQQRVVGTVARAAAIADAPGFFADAQPGLALANGFLSVSAEGAALLPHSPEHRVAVGLPMPYDATTPAPRFERFLREIFAGDEDAGAKQTLIQQFVGACLAGVATRYQASLVLVGTGSNGKSVLIDIVQALFPVGTVVAIPPQDLGQEYRRAMLAGARLNAVSEMSAREFIDTEAFKAAIAGDMLTGRYIRQAPFSFKPIAGHLFSVNVLPGTKDLSNGFWRRFLPIELKRRFMPPDQDPNLACTIIANELPGVMAWAIAGAVSVMKAGYYALPRSVLVMRSEWQRRSDQVRRFAEEELCVSHDAETFGSAIYSRYVVWAKKNGTRPLASSELFPGLMSLELGIERHRTNAGNVYNCELRRTPYRI